MDSGYIKTLWMYSQWLYQYIVHVWTVVISRHCLCIDSGYIKTLCIYGLAILDIVYVWTVVISRHCSCIDSGYIKTLFMNRQWLYQDIVYV